LCRCADDGDTAVVVTPVRPVICCSVRERFLALLLLPPTETAGTTIVEDIHTAMMMMIDD